MAQIIWDAVEERTYQTGLDKAVLYTETAAVPWNGLRSVDVQNEGQSVTPVYFDDKKVNEVVYVGDFAATMKAYTYPEEFIPYDGYAEPVAGMYLDNQDRGTFGLSYRTLIGNDTDGTNYGYRLHLLYNLTALSDGIGYQTVESNIEPIEFSWKLSSVPDQMHGFRPSSHIVIDSTKVDPVALGKIEEMLYGTEATDPYLPSIEEVYTNVALVIIDNGDGTWMAVGSDNMLFPAVGVFGVEDYQLLHWMTTDIYPFAWSINASTVDNTNEEDFGYYQVS